MAMTGLGNKGLRHEINITPYIDVLLVLLIIFMVTAPMKKYEQPVRVPQPPPPQQQKMSKPDSIIVEMDLDHSITLNRRAVTIQELGPALASILSTRTNKSMFVRGASSLPYGDVFKILDISKKAGAADIALLEKAEAGPAQRAEGTAADPQPGGPVAGPLLADTAPPPGAPGGLAGADGHPVSRRSP
jgi:biopolymer transport protein ExbD